MPSYNVLGFKIRTLGRLLLLVGVRPLRRVWNSNTVAESFEGKATPLEAAAFLTLQNLPRLKKRKGIDRALRRYIQDGLIRRGVLANGYPDPVPEQASLFSSDSEDREEATTSAATTRDLVTLIEEVSADERRAIARQTAQETVQETTLPLDEYDFEDEEDYDSGPGFAQGVLIGAGLVSLLPLWMWLQPVIQGLPAMQEERYSPQVVKVAAARGQDCTRARDLYSQLYCGELWRKELSARVEQSYSDLLAVSTAIDNMQRATGFELEVPLARRVQQAHENWQAHVESRCNTGSAITNLGSQRSNQYLDCVHSHLLEREKEIREQLNFLRGLGWEEEAADALNNELIAIRNMVATQPAQPAVKKKTEDKETIPPAENETGAPESAGNDAETPAQ